MLCLTSNVMLCLCSTAGSAANLLSGRPLPAADEGSSRREEIWSNVSVSEQYDLFLTDNEQVLY